MTVDLFDSWIQAELGIEGGYSNNPADAGGETIWGITAVVAAQYGYTGPMAAMTRDQAIAIYRPRNWTDPGFDQAALISAPVADFLLDTGINMGIATAGLFLQRLLNVLCNNGQDFARLPMTGVVGPQTRAALFAFLKKRGAVGEAVLLSALKGLRDARYIDLAEQSAADQTFEFGWLQRVFNLTVPVQAS